MTTYDYKVRDRDGKVLKGSMEASDAKDLRKKLDDNNYFIIEYAEKKSGTGILNQNLFSFSSKVKMEDISAFSWQLYTMLNAGVTLTNTLSIIENQTKNTFLKSVFRSVNQSVEEGLSFSDALREHPNVFSKLYVQMINAGEVGGALDEMLKRMAFYYEDQAKVRSRVRLALIYPTFLISVSLIVVCFLVTYVLPRFKFIFDDMGLMIPWSTRLLLDLSAFLNGNWFVILAAFVGAVFMLKAYLSTYAGKFQFDAIKLNTPIIGDLIRKTTAARFTQTLSILVSGGIPILTSLDVVTEVIDNLIVVKVMKDVSSMVGEGKTISKPLGDSGIFPEMVVNMIRVGEETGALEEMLTKVSEFYNREVDNAIETFTKLIEPCLIVLMTVVIGFIAVSIFLPMADLMQGMHV